MSDRVRVPFRPSRTLPAAILLAHLLAASGLFLAGVPYWPALAGCAAIGASAAWRIFLAIRRRDLSAVLELSADGSCAITGMPGLSGGTLRADSVALRWLVILRLDGARSRGARSLVLLPDSMGAEDWRRLRVFLRWGVRFAAEGSTPSAGPPRAGPDSRG